MDSPWSLDGYTNYVLDSLFNSLGADGDCLSLTYFGDVGNWQSCLMSYIVCGLDGKEGLGYLLGPYSLAEDLKKGVSED